MAPLGPALTLAAGLVALPLLMSPVIATHASTPQNASSATAADPDRARQQSKVIQIQQEAVALLKRAAAVPADDAASRQLLIDAANRFELLAAEASAASTNPATKSALLPEDLLQELRQASRTLRNHAQKRPPSAAAFSAEPFLELLGRVAGALGPHSLEDLAFQGSYSQPKVAEPAYGGHASAMGPPPMDRRAAGAASKTASPVQFEEVPCISTKTFCGGRTKDHIVESGGSGVALVRLRRRRVARRVSRHRVRALGRTREDPPSQRAFQKPGWVEIPGRLRGVGPRCCRLGQRRMCWRLRR